MLRPRREMPQGFARGEFMVGARHDAGDEPMKFYQRLVFLCGSSGSGNDFETAIVLL